MRKKKVQLASLKGSNKINQESIQQNMKTQISNQQQQLQQQMQVTMQHQAYMQNEQQSESQDAIQQEQQGSNNNSTSANSNANNNSNSSRSKNKKNKKKKNLQKAKQASNQQEQQNKSSSLKGEKKFQPQSDQEQGMLLELEEDIYEEEKEDQEGEELLIKKQGNMPCLLCNNQQEYFKRSILALLFNSTDFQKQEEELSSMQQLGQASKQVCGKILKKSDKGFKCLDCEMDSTCIICQECFEKGNHKGHRIFIQQQCSGCCDCGDPEAWKKEGFCSLHKGLQKEAPMDLKDLPPNFIITFKEVILEVFYQFFSLCENYYQNVGDNALEQQQQRLNELFIYVLHLIQFVVGGSQLMNLLMLNVLNSSFQLKQLMQHDCENINKFRLRLAKKSDSKQQEQIFPAKQLEQQMDSQQPTLKAMQQVEYEKEGQDQEGIKKNQDQYVMANCSCTLLENLFRFNFFCNRQMQIKLAEFFISMFSSYQFKQKLIQAYTKMYNFLFFSKEFIQYDNNKSKKLKQQQFVGNIQANDFESEIDEEEEYNNSGGGEDQENQGRNEQQRANNNMAVEEDIHQNQNVHTFYDITSSELMHINVQLFTSEELAILSLQSNHFFQIFESIQLLLRMVNNNKRIQHIYENFWKNYQHIKYICMKTQSLEKFLVKPGVFENLIKLIKLIHYACEFNCNEKTMNMLSDFPAENFYIIEIEDSIMDSISKMVGWVSLNYKDNRKRREEIFGPWISLVVQNIQKWMLQREQRLEASKGQQLITSFHAPLTRTFSILLLAICDYNLDNLLKRERRLRLSELCQMNFETQFIPFLLMAMAAPINVMGLNKEIDKNLWVYQGLNVSNYPKYYIRSKLGFLNQDVLQMQATILCLSGQWQEQNNKKESMDLEANKNSGKKGKKISAVDTVKTEGLFKYIAEQFCLRKFWKWFINVKEQQLKVVKKGQQQSFAKQVMLFGEFLTFLCSLMIDEVSSVNVAHSLLKEDKIWLDGEFLPQLRNFLISYFQQNKAMDIQKIKTSLFENIFNSKINLEELLMQVAVFDKQRKAFVLKEQFEEKLIEPYIFLNDPKIFSEYLDKIQGKYLQQQDKIHYSVIGVQDTSIIKTRQYLLAIRQLILTPQFFAFNLRFLKLLMPLVHLPSIENQRSIINCIIHPLLKLISISVDLAQENCSANNTEQPQTLKSLLNLILQQKVISDEAIQSINILNAKLSKVEQQYELMQKMLDIKINIGQHPQQQQQQFVSDNAMDQQQQQQLSDTLSSKLDIVSSKPELNAEQGRIQPSSIEGKMEQQKNKAKLMQQQIMQKYQQKAQQFSQKNTTLIQQEQVQELDNLKGNQNEELCVICKDVINKTMIYGVCAYATKSNLQNHSLFQMHLKSATYEQRKERARYLDSFSFMVHPRWKIFEPTFSITSCYHLIHFQCYKEYLTNKRKSNYGTFTEYEYFCPLCNSLSNLFVTFFENTPDIFYRVDATIIQNGISNNIQKQKEKQQLQQQQQQQRQQQNNKIIQNEVNICGDVEQQGNQQQLLNNNNNEDKPLDNQQVTEQKVIDYNDDDFKDLKEYFDDLNEDAKIQSDQEFVALQTVYQKYVLPIINKNSQTPDLANKLEDLEIDFDYLSHYMDTLMTIQLMEYQEQEQAARTYAEQQLEMFKKKGHDQNDNNQMINEENKVNSIPQINTNKNEPDSDNLILNLQEDCIVAVIKNIDITGLPEFIKKRVRLYKSIITSYLHYFSQFNSKAKGNFLLQKMQFCQTYAEILMNGVIKEKYDINNKCCNDDDLCRQKAVNELINQYEHVCGLQPIFLNCDLENSFICYCMNIMMYYKTEKAITVIQGLIPFILAGIVMQILIKKSQDFMNFEITEDKLVAALKEEANIKFLIPIMRKVSGVLILFFDYDQESLQTVLKDEFLSDEQEFIELLKICQISQEYMNILIMNNGATTIQNWIRHFRLDINQQQSQLELQYKQQQIINKIPIVPLHINILSVDMEFYVNFVPIENKFGDLYKYYLGNKCELCKDFPKYGDLCLCLICGCTLCSTSCQHVNQNNRIGNLNWHSSTIHCGSSIFLGLSESKIYLIKSPRNIVMEGLYYDEYGQPFQKKSNDWNKYQLDISQYNKIKKFVYLDKLAQQICYDNIRLNKLYYDNIF